MPALDLPAQRPTARQRLARTVGLREFLTASSFAVTTPSHLFGLIGAPSASSWRTPLLVAVISVVFGLGLPGVALAQDVGPNPTPATCYESGANFACGSLSRATGNDSTVVGALATATQRGTAALGWNAHATGLNSTALGSRATASGEAAVALGTGSIANENYTVSVGDRDNGLLRRIVNMADGVGDSDAATVGQMNAADAATLADANAYTDGREAAIRTDMAAGDAATLASANLYTDGREALIRSDMAAGDAATLADANAYTDGRETAIRSDMAAGDAATLADANAYTDGREALIRSDMAAGDARTLSSANFYTDQQFGRLETAMNGRFRAVEVRMDQVTAMSAAFAAMAGNDAGAGSGARSRLVVGVGNYGSETALSVGYSRVISERTAFNAGVSFTGGEVMSGGSFGFAW